MSKKSGYRVGAEVMPRECVANKKIKAGTPCRIQGDQGLNYEAHKNMGWNTEGGLVTVVAEDGTSSVMRADKVQKYYTRNVPAVENAVAPKRAPKAKKKKAVA